jgi:hypothetical protein
MIQISVLMGNGSCKWVMTGEDSPPICRSIAGCKPTVTRTWSGLPANAALEFCVVLDEDLTMCLQNPPNAGEGSGSDVRPSASQACDSSGSRTYQFTVPSCSLAAGTDTLCSSCDGL